MVDAAPHPWPQPLDPDALRRREEAAASVAAARARFAESGVYEDPEAPPLLLDDEEQLAGWDADLERLLDEARAARSADQAVPLPAQLSTTAIMRLQADPEAFAAELARPMPQPPSRAARFGTRFHLWVERYLGPGRPTGALGQQPLVDPDDLPDRADAGAHGEQELRELCAAFAAGQFGRTVPYALEAPFSVALAGRLVRGRIDAVYADTAERVRLPGGGLEDQPERVGRPAAAGDLPAGLGRGQPASAGGGGRGLLLRPHRPPGPAARAARPALRSNRLLAGG